MNGNMIQSYYKYTSLNNLQGTLDNTLSVLK